MSRRLVGTWVEPNVVLLVKDLAAVKGVSVSELLRELILADLDRRTVFTKKLKEKGVDPA